MKGILYILVALSLCLLAPAAQAQKAKKLETATLSVQYPDSWKADSARLNINGTIRLAPINNAMGQLGTEVVIDFRPLEKNLDAMIAESENSVIRGGEMLKGGLSTMEIGGAPACKTVLRLGQLYTITNQVIYNDKLCRITCFTNSDKPEELQRDFDLIVSSIKFK